MEYLCNRNVPFVKYLLQLLRPKSQLAITISSLEKETDCLRSVYFKMSFWCLPFSQKMEENNWTRGTIVVKSDFLFVFWENRRYQKVISKLTDLQLVHFIVLQTAIVLNVFTIFTESEVRPRVS